MSTFVNLAIHHKTCKPQQALFIGNHHDSHRYSVGFMNDITDADLFDMENINSEYTIYPIEAIEINKDTERVKL